MKLAFKTFVLLTVITSLLLAFNQAMAQDGNSQNDQNKMYSGKLVNPLGSENLGPADIYGRLIYGFIGTTGAVSLLMFVIGGFKWMTAAGNKDKIKSGRDTLMWAVLGLLVIFSSYAILRAIFQTLQFSGG